MSLSALFDTPFGLPLACLAFAVVIVAPGYMSPYMNGIAVPAPMPERFPYRSAIQAVLIVFLLVFGVTVLARYALGFGRGSDFLWALGAILLLGFVWKLRPNKGTVP